MSDAASREVITAKEAAARLGVSLASTYALIHRGELEGYAVGRRKLVYADSLDAYRERHAFAKAKRPSQKPATPAPGGRQRRAREQPRLTPASHYIDPLTGEFKPFRHFR